MVTTIQAKRIISSTGEKLMCRKLREIKTKRPNDLQVFAEDWCGVVMSLYVINHQKSTLRKANYYDTGIRYTSNPVDIAHLL
jgi:hypothetical protein